MSNRRLIFFAWFFAYSSALPIVVVVYSLLFKLKRQALVAPVVDYGLRDFSAALFLWLLGGVFVTFFLNRRLDRLLLQLSSLMKRVADGDRNPCLPRPDEPILRGITDSIGQALERSENHDRLRIERLSELQSTVRRVLELVDAPVLVIGFQAHHRLTLDYVNGATASAFGESLESLEGALLESVVGGYRLRSLVETVLRKGGMHYRTALEGDDGEFPKHVVDCAIVRNRLGIPTRLVVVLKKADQGAWWRCLWENTTETGQG